MAEHRIVTKTPSDQDIQKILDCMTEDNFHNKTTYYKTLVMLGAFAGLRMSEAVAVNIEDVSFEEHTLIIKQQKNGNYCEKVYLPHLLREQLWLHFKTYSKEISKHKGYLFFSKRNDNHISKRSLEEFIRYLRLLTGLNKVYNQNILGDNLYVFSYHSLRHYYIQKICDKRGLYAANLCARHENIKSTILYLKNSLEKKKEIIENVFNDKKEEEIIISMAGMEA